MVIRLSSGGFISTRGAEMSSRAEHNTFSNLNSVSRKLGQALVHSHTLCALTLPAVHFLHECFLYFSLISSGFLSLSVPLCPSLTANN